MAPDRATAPPCPRRSLILQAAVYMLLSLVSAPSMFAQQTPVTNLPPEAQESVKKGILAAQQQDYLLAIRYFQDVRKTAAGVYAPEVLYNLGLAESKIPGRELRAICWFDAYLAVMPSAPNAAAVQQQIDALDVKSQINLSRYIKSVQDAVNKLPVSEKVASLDFPVRRMWMQDVAELWIEAGDIQSAQPILDDATPLEKLHIASEVADVNLEGRPDLAKAIVLGLGNDLCTAVAADNGGDFYNVIANLARGDDLDDALTLLTRCKAPQVITADHYAEAWIEVAKAQLRKSDLSGALASVAEARKSKNWDYANYSNLAKTQAAAGDYAGAQATIGAITTTTGDADPEADPEEYFLFFAQATHGDVNDAHQTANQIVDRTGMKFQRGAILEALRQLDAGQHVQWSTGGIKDPYHPAIRATDVSAWTGEVLDLNDQLHTDLAGYLQSQQTDTPVNLVSSLIVTGESLITAQNTVDEMLKQQARQR